jgi:hypothetical protein
MFDVFGLPVIDIEFSKWGLAGSSNGATQAHTFHHCPPKILKSTSGFINENLLPTYRKRR